VIATIVSAVAVVLSATLAGQLLCAICGASRWTAAAPAVGLSTLLLIAVPGLHLPGRMTLPFVATVVLALAGAALLARRPAHRSPFLGALAGLLALAVTLVPFIAQRRFGTLGMSFNNDMGLHLLFAGSYRDATLQAAVPLLDYYPFGPHAFVAELGHGFGLGLDGVFAGLTIAMPVLSAITAFSLLDRVSRLAAVVAALAAGLQYLSAAYMGQGAFKEVMLVTLLLGTAGALAALRDGRHGGVLRLVPLGLLAAGVLSMYSLPGLAWIGGIVALTAVLAAVPLLRSGGVGAVVGAGRGLVVPAAVAGGLAVLVLIPQVPRLRAFWRYLYRTSEGAGIDKHDLGNLAGPLRFLESTGIWLSADFRFPPQAQTVSTVLGVAVLLSAAAGAALLLRRARPELVAGAVVCLVLAWWSSRTQSPYATAKALVVLSPFLVLLAAVGLTEPRAGGRLGRAVLGVVALGLVAAGAVSSFLTLRYLPVAARTHEQQLAQLRPYVQGKKVLFLGNDEFGQWYLSGAIVAQPTFATGRRDVPTVTVLPVKAAGPLDGYDWDSFGNLDRFDAVITTRDPWLSQPPESFRLERTVGPWALYRRVGTTPVRGVLSSEHAAAGATLDCRSAEGRAVLRGGGRAGVRRPPVRADVPPIAAGGTAPAVATLSPGVWDVGFSYAWRAPVRLRVGGVSRTFPASLERQGVRYPVGRIRVPAGRQRVAVRVQPVEPRLGSPILAMNPSTVMFTPVARERVVPVRAACGRYLDWYEPARP
jgi:hypothetical protein